MMWQKKIDSVNYDSEKLTESHSIWDVFFASEGSFNGNPLKPLRLIRQGALLRILEGKTYTFLHYALLEYFSVKGLFQSTANKASIALGLEINAQLITEDYTRIQLGVDCVNSNPEFEQALWDILEESKHEQRVEIAAANAITILAAANKSFAGKDFRHIRVKGANVVGGNFEGADLQEADLRDVNICQAWMNNANLNGSCVDRVQTGELFSETLDSKIMACAFFPKGIYYAVMTEKNLFIYDTATHKKMKTYKPKLNNNDDKLHAIGFSPLSDFLLLGTEKGQIMHLSVPSEKVLRVWHGHNGKVNSLAISPDSYWAFSGSDDKTIKRWDVRTGQCQATYNIHKGHVTAIVICPDGQSALSGSWDNTIKRWDIQSGRCETTWEGHTNTVSSLALSLDGRWALSGSWDNTIKRWDVQSGSCVVTWVGHNDRVRTVALCSDGHCALSGSDDTTIKVWEVNSGYCVSTWVGSIFGIDNLALNPDSRWVLLGSDNTIKRWEVATKRSETMGLTISNMRIALALNRDSHSVLSESKDRTIKRWNIDAGYCEATWRGLPGVSYHLAFSQDGQWAFSIFDDNTIKRWNIETGRKEVITECNMDRITAIAFALSPDSRWMLLTDNKDYSIHCWEIDTGRCISTLRGHTATVQVIAFSPDGRWALSGSEDETIKRWSIQSGLCESTWRGQTYGLSALAISPDSLYTLSASIDHTIKRWQVQSGSCKSTWMGHTSFISVITFSPDGRWAISGGFDCQLFLWETHRDAKRGQYAFTQIITKVLWSNIDPTLVVVGMCGGTVSAWTFNAETASLHLRWRSNSWDLAAVGCKFLGAYGLPYEQLQVLIQKGSQVQVSAKPSEGEKGVLALLNQLTLFNPNHPPISLFDTTHIITPGAWVISIARRKTGDAKRHAFLILESIEEGYYRIRRIDFVLEQRHRMLQEEHGTGQQRDIFGQALIEVADKSLFDVQSLVGQCCAQSSGITPGQGLRLLDNIRRDQSEKIGYCLMGAGSIYSMFRIKDSEEQHNCLSWCEKHLDAIGVNLVQRSWIDGIVSYTPSKLKEKKLKTPTISSNQQDEFNNNNNNDEEPNSGSNCILM